MDNSTVDTALGYTANWVKNSGASYLESLPVPSSVEELSSLGPDAWYQLLPLIVLITAPFTVAQACKKVLEAHDLGEYSSGWFKFNSFFYSGSPLSAAPFLLGFVPGLLALVATHWAGQWAWLVAFAAYVLVPIADLFLGVDAYNATKEEEKRLLKQPLFRLITIMYTPSYIFTIFYGCYVFSTRPELTLWELVGITVSVGIAGGFGIGCVHELIHRPSQIELGMGIVATVFANYSHFWIEHIFGHHKRVATDEDPASSGLGDDLYTFLVRDIYKSFVDAVAIERRFLKKNKLGFLSNRILQGYACSALIALGIYHLFGTRALWFYIGQGVITALHIENANYIEHYGLRRRKVEGKKSHDGENIYERPGWFHAWDTADRLSNWMTFKIQRHPDHHTNAGRPYQILRTLPFSPTMPTGYAGMFVLSWFPPLFFAVMDPLVATAYRKREEMEANGLAASVFPKGCNNMSSYFKREGEGYFEEGSSPYDKDYYGSDVNTTPAAVWESHKKYNKEDTDKNAKFVETGKFAEKFLQKKQAAKKNQ